MPVCQSTAHAAGVIAVPAGAKVDHWQHPSAEGCVRVVVHTPYATRCSVESDGVTPYQHHTLSPTLGSLPVHDPKNTTEFFAWQPTRNSNVWGEVMKQSPYLLTPRPQFKNDVIPQLYPGWSNVRDLFVEINVGQVLVGYGVQVCGFIAKYFGFEAFSAHEQGQGTTRMLILRSEAFKLVDMAKRQGMRHDGAYIDKYEIKVHVRCTEDGVYICHGPTAMRDINAVNRSHRCPRSTCDITEAHSGALRGISRRLEKTRHCEQQRQQTPVMVQPSPTLVLTQPGAPVVPPTPLY